MKESSDVSMNISRFFRKYILSSLGITLRQQNQQCYQQQQSQQLRCQLQVSRHQQPDHICYHNLQIRWQPLRLQQNKKSSSFFAIFNFYNLDKYMSVKVFISIFFGCCKEIAFSTAPKIILPKLKKVSTF